MRSFERATTELMADLDTPALTEALKTAERLQISEQRVATLEASLTRQQNLRMHREITRAIDILVERAAANHSHRKVFMQYSGAEREATLGEPYLMRGYHVPEFATVCLRAGAVAEHRHALAKRINSTSRSSTNSAPVCTNGSSFWAARMLRYAIGVWTCSTKCEEVCAEHDCVVLYFEVHGDLNAADRAANAPVCACDTAGSKSRRTPGAFHTGEAV